MLRTIRTDSNNLDFQQLVTLLDNYLREKDGDDHSFFAQFNKIDLIKHVIVAYDDDLAVGCGAIKEYSEGTMEIKRMYVTPEQRRKGIASLILKELEGWAKELSYQRCILETGEKQVEALRLYKENRYVVTANYGQYENVTSSTCFEKELF